MKHVYSNGSDPKAAGWLAGCFLAVGIASYILYIAFSSDKDDFSLIFELVYMLFWGLSWYFIWKSTKCEIDDEAGTLIVPECKKYPIKIADIDTVTYCQTKRGRLRYITIHEKGTRFANVSLTRRKAEGMVAHLLRLNPSITTKVINYS